MRSPTAIPINRVRARKLPGVSEVQQRRNGLDEVAAKPKGKGAVGDRSRALGSFLASGIDFATPSTARRESKVPNAIDQATMPQFPSGARHELGRKKKTRRLEGPSRAAASMCVGFWYAVIAD